MTIRTERERQFLLVGLFSMLSILAAAASGGAQEQAFQRGSQLITGFTGPFFSLGGEAEDSDEEGSDGIEFESDWAFGGGYQYFFTPNLSVEASFTYGRGEGEIEGAPGDDPEDTDDEGNEEEEGESAEEGGASGHALYFTGSLVYNFRPEGRLVPFVTAGAGLVRVNVDGSNASRPAGVFGGGLMLGLSESLLLRVDVRDQLYSLDQGGSSSTVNDLSVTGGVSVRF